MPQKNRALMMAVARTRRAWSDHTKAVALEIGITDSYRAVIGFLSRQPGVSQKELADFCNVTTAAISQTLKEMVRDGYVEKVTDDRDRRYTKLYLTQKGEETACRIRERLKASDEAITQALTPGKEKEMIELLDKIHDLIRRDLSSC